MKSRKSQKVRSTLPIALLLVIVTMMASFGGTAAAIEGSSFKDTLVAIHLNNRIAPITPKITIFSDGTVRTLEYVNGTVDDLLTAQGISVGGNDRVSPAESVTLTPGLTITIIRADTHTITVDEVVPHATVYIANEYLPKGTEVIIAEGNDGRRVVDYEVTLCGGVEVSRRAVEVEVTAAAVDRVVEYGPGGTIVTDAGKVIHWSHKIDGQATAYTTEGYRNKRNALGRIARPGTIAVDPKVIPLKSSVYVEGNGWIYGESVAEDTGGAVKGNIVDLFFNTRAECFQFGRKSCTIYVLESV